ncbi:MAG: flagellar basal body P-ring protein FlgI [Desulfobacterota bacterium]|jgi:flagellar P-ring protein precursor FlgI|nr:flagellar basal body P-ring protein FlgI [Thermodesulfobacteriota bacterium]
MCGRFKSAYCIALLVVLFLPWEASGARIKDIVSIKGIRPNQLFGYGLIIGLNGSGDKDGTTFTVQGLVNMLERQGIHVSALDVKVSNVAAVMVSATLPPFARVGKKLDITVSSIGDAKSLQGGTLLMTPLKGADGKVYALAQGPVAVGGYTTSGAAGGGATKNHPTVGMISGGATVEREIPLSLDEKKEFTLVLNHPDFMTASRIVEQVNEHFREPLAKPVDSGTLKIQVPQRFQDNVVTLLAEVGQLEVKPDTDARVIVNERTGTVVIGENVRISTVAVAHGNLSIQIKETKQVSQPLPFAPPGRGQPTRTEDGVTVAPGGATVVTPDSDVSVGEEQNRLLLIPEGRTVGDLVRALNAIGISPRDLITVLQAVKAAGALHGELEII